MKKTSKLALVSSLIVTCAFILQSCGGSDELNNTAVSQTLTENEDYENIINLNETGIESPACEFCSDDQTCVNGICYDNDRKCGDTFCEGVEECMDGICTIDDCNNSCPEGLTCFWGECWLVCGDDICDVGESCVDGFCQALCGDDICDDNEACFDGQCVEADRICDNGTSVCDDGQVCIQDIQMCGEEKRYCKQIGAYCGNNKVCIESTQECVLESRVCDNGNICSWGETCVNNVCEAPAEEGIQLRMMAANITSGSKQSYDVGHGARIFRGLKPDIVLIQEFNYFKGSLRSFVDDTFGKDYHYCVGNGQIPNGIISRYPIKEVNGTSCQAWSSNVVANRDWNWAVIDLPGDRDLLAVSVHLHTSKNASEMPVLANQIQKKMDKGNYYVVLGGDFNTTSRNSAQTNFASILDARKPYPVDNKGNEGTNAKRSKPYDWLLVSHDFAKFEVPVQIGDQSFANGLVFDSRVFTPLSDVSPVQKTDSGASNMQHMAVVRDFFFKTK